MARKKNYMPMGMAGIQRFDEGGAKFQLSPGTVIVLCVFVILIEIGLHLFL